MDDIIARIRRLPGDTLVCLAFFSRIPCRPTDTAAELKDAAGAWPVAGLVIAAGPALCLALMLAGGIAPLVASAIALAMAAAITGCLHEDGLSDTADGFGGGHDRDAKLAIMTDSRIGTYGALALTFALLIRVAALAGLSVSIWAGAAAILGVAVLSRATAIWHWHLLPPAKADGLAAAAGQPDMNAAVSALAWAAIAAVFVLLVFGGAGFFGCVLAGMSVPAFNRLCRYQIGGHTGDTIGASQLVAECALYAGLSAAGAIAP